MSQSSPGAFARSVGYPGTKYDAAGLRPPKEADLNFQPRSEHEEEPPKIAKELHDRAVHRGDVKNMWP
jgi:hypothetical protein